MSRVDAFSLLEAMVTLALMALVSVAAISAFATFSRLSKNVERESLLIESSAVGLSYLTSELRQAGGVGLLPWASVIVEDDCGARGGLPACHNSDRLTVLQGIPTFPGCRVIEDRGRDLVFEQVDFDCCFNDSAPFLRQVAMIKDDVMQPVVLAGKGRCVFERRPIVPDDALPRSPSGSWNGAIAVLADVKTFYVDWNDAGDEGALTMHIELDGRPGVEGERMTILERVVDFQAVVAYPAGDGLSLESASGLNDDWWPSVDGLETRRAVDNGFNPERARFVGFSTISISDGGNVVTHVQTPWGPPRVLTNRLSSLGVERLALPQE